MWFPYDDRILEQLKYSVFVQTALGEFRTIERKGPENLLKWEASWAVFRVALIGLSVVAPAILDAYHAAIRQLVNEYPEAWGNIADAENQLRKHESVRIRREGEMAYMREESWARDYNPGRPWEFVFRQLSNPNHEYWVRTVRRPIELGLPRTGGRRGAQRRLYRRRLYLFRG